MIKIIIIIIIVTIIVAYMTYICALKHNAIGNKIDYHVRLYLLHNNNIPKFDKMRQRLSKTPEEFKLFEYSKTIEKRQTMSMWQRFNLAYIPNFLFNWSPHLIEDAVPYVQTIIKRLADKSSLQVDQDAMQRTIVIHLRCSDVPFVRNPEYVLYKCTAYTKAVRLALQNQPFDRIMLIYATSHQSNHPQNKVVCDKVASTIQEEIKKALENETNMKCEIAGTGNMYDDIKLMYTAGCLVGFAGSFVFYIGIGKPNLFVSKCQSLRKGMLHLSVTEDRIDHSEVQNYHNVDEVYDKLISNNKYV